LVADIFLLILSSSQAEFTHPFGPIALLGAVTALAALEGDEGVGS
jgi:hypothetical protein